jgi:hypothetical protein
MQRRIEPHQLTDRIRGKLLFLLAWPTFVAALRRSRQTELWIGDSHAMTSTRTVTNSMFMRAGPGILVVRAGARLMYSISRNGFPERVQRVARTVERFGRPGAFIPVFSAGEIDVRVHLAERPDETFDFVAGYVDRCLALARELKAIRVGFMVPVPPVNLRDEDIWFPVVGTLEQRLEAHKRLRDALAAAVERTPGAVLLDFTPLLSGPDGGMPAELTFDGAHTNDKGVARIRREIIDRRLLAG